MIALASFEFLCALKQALGCAYSKDKADDSAKRDIERARIEQNLKCVVHTYSSRKLRPVRSLAVARC